MNTQTTRYILVAATGLVAFAGVFAWTTIPLSATATTITNNVSVSANGGTGKSSTAVHTTINGEVIEDYTETSSGSDISYSSTITADDHSADVETHVSTTAPQTNTEAQLRSLLDQLLTLLSLYVSNHS